MVVKKDAHGAEGFWTGLAILTLGVVLGAVARPSLWSDPAGGGDAPPPGPEAGPSSPLVPHDGGAARAPGDLTLVELEIPPESAAVLARVRALALDRGLIVQSDEDTVPATLVADGRRLPALVRLKGDWIDHVETDKWSLRIELLEGTLLGMRVFSIQSPHTRGFLWEWLVLETGRREGLLAPRATFVDVVLDGRAAGIYFLEEHFSKELIESQGRRDGPIVRWEEGTGWETRLQSHSLAGPRALFPPPVSAARTQTFAAAAVRAYGERHLASDDTLARALRSAVEKMEDLRTLAIAGQSHDDPVLLARALEQLHAGEGARADFKKVEIVARSYEQRAAVLQALARRTGASVDGLVDAERLARAHALYSLMQVRHGLITENMRYYLDPVVDRLEPVLFDNMAHHPAPSTPLPLRGDPGVFQLTQVFARSRAYVDGVFRHLGRMCAPGWLDDLFAGLEPELSRFEAALASEQPLEPGFRVDDMRQRLRAQQVLLRRVLYPARPLNTAALAVFEADAGAPVAGMLEVQTWATTRTPVVVEAFRFGNGSELRARAVLASDPSLVSFDGEGGVVLPYDGVPVRFRFPMDARLANLDSVQQVKQAVREQTRAGGPRLDVSIVFRPLAARESRSEALVFRRQDPSWSAAGRPEPPTLDDALEQHPFLDLDLVTGELVVRPGDWDVQGDLVLPRGVSLRAGPGVRLAFQPQAVLLSESPLHLEGTRADPVRLEPAEQGGSWRGVCVLGAPARSSWRHVLVRGTDAVARGGWTLTGAVTFHGSPVDIVECRFEGSAAEDALNVVGTDLLLDRVAFSDCASDAFDGDFVTGAVRACSFRDTAGDGLDVSGSRLEVSDCVFQRLGDKALSVGEGSTLEIRGGRAVDVGIALASKDGSRALVEDLLVRGARNYALATYVKKDEYGPAEIVALGLDVAGSGLGDTLVQDGCRLVLDGRELETSALDVSRLYEEGVLGR